MKQKTIISMKLNNCFSRFLFAGTVRPPHSSRRHLKLLVRTKSGKPRCSLIAFLYIGWCPLDGYTIFSALFSEDGRGWTIVLTKRESIREMFMFSNRLFVALTSCNVLSLYFFNIFAVRHGLLSKTPFFIFSSL